jgi:hypothetical protein
MRISRLIVLAGVVAATAVPLSDAQARGRRGGRLFLFSSSTGTGTAAHVASPGDAAAGTAARVSKDGPVDATSDSVPQRKAAASVPNPEPANSTRVAVAAAKVALAEWCPSHRIVGSGAGFCDLNPQPIR